VNSELAESAMPVSFFLTLLELLPVFRNPLSFGAKFLSYLLSMSLRESLSSLGCSILCQLRCLRLWFTFTVLELIMIIEVDL